jgi:hypothetical protein
VSDPFPIPQLTRGLRSFASPASLGPTHDRFFAPLLDARRAAQRAGTWSSRLSAFDADRLEAILHATLRSLAEERHPKSAPDRRALAAQLDDACGDMFDAIAALGRAARAVTEAPSEDARRRAWQTWLLELHGVFAGADRGWERSAGILALVSR